MDSRVRHQASLAAMRVVSLGLYADVVRGKAAHTLAELHVLLSVRCRREVVLSMLSGTVGQLLELRLRASPRHALRSPRQRHNVDSEECTVYHNSRSSSTLLCTERQSSTVASCINGGRVTQLSGSIGGAVPQFSKCFEALQNLRYYRSRASEVASFSYSV
jgi:hypothetical protein